MPFNSPPSAVTGDFITAAFYNNYIRNNVLYNYNELFGVFSDPVAIVGGKVGGMTFPVVTGSANTGAAWGSGPGPTNIVNVTVASGKYFVIAEYHHAFNAHGVLFTVTNGDINGGDAAASSFPPHTGNDSGSGTLFGVTASGVTNLVVTAATDGGFATETAVSATLRWIGIGT